MQIFYGQTSLTIQHLAKRIAHMRIVGASREAEQRWCLPINQNLPPPPPFRGLNHIGERFHLCDDV